MKYSLLPVLLIALPLLAEFDTQTDWSGGPGLLGPLPTWGTRFYSDTDTRYYDTTGQLELSSVHKHVVGIAGEDCYGAYSGDIDGDGDVDVTTIARTGDMVSWWENLDGSGTLWTEHDIQSFNDGRAICIEDMDGDGDNDVAAVCYNPGIIAWWENVNGAGTSWVKHNVDTSIYGARSFCCNDLDGDGDIDVLSHNNTQLFWWKNMDGIGQIWQKNLIGSYSGTNNLLVEDLDDDGDADFVATSYNEKIFYWWSNRYGTGLLWDRNTICEKVFSTNTVASADINDDGTVDVITGGFTRIEWWENSDTSPGVYWTKHEVNTGWRSADLFAEDMDLDGDVDIVSAGQDSITLWDNINYGSGWSGFIVAYNFGSGVPTVSSNDVNDDGLPDIVGSASNSQDEVAWWDLTGYSQGGIVSSILNTDCIPYWDEIDWTADTPSGSAIRFLVRSSRYKFEMGSWSDTISTPGSLGSYLEDGEKYVQYIALLSSGNPSVTPVLYDVTLSWNLTGIEEQSGDYVTGLLPVLPNPLSYPAIVSFCVDELSEVHLAVFDISGRVIEEFSGSFTEGRHDLVLNDLQPGVYLIRMNSMDLVQSGRFVVID